VFAAAGQSMFQSESRVVGKRERWRGYFNLGASKCGSSRLLCIATVTLIHWTVQCTLQVTPEFALRRRARRVYY
jgi:hypothetical protein